MTAAPVAARRGGAVTAALSEIEGRRVAWFRLAGGKHRGAIGTTEGQIMERTVRLALEAGVPVVGEIATSGADVTEGLASLVAWGRVAKALTDASGTLPIILTVTGPCVGGPALLLGLADHVVMTAEAYAYVSGPRAAESITGVTTDHTDLGGPEVHFSRSGVASLVVLDEEEAAGAVADLLSYLPSNHLDEPPLWPTADPADRRSKVAAGVVPERPTASYDVRAVIEDVCDVGSFLEVRVALATNAVTGYARLAGTAIGVIANQPKSQAGTLDIEASRKAARFVQCCDAFGLPLLTFVDCGGFRPGRDLEWRGMIRHGAELVHAYANATVPRLCVVLRKAYGGAYIAMDSRGLGNDLCLAWPSAEIAVMGAPGAVTVLQRRKLAAIEDAGERARVQAELEADYNERLCSPVVAAERGYVDDVIDPNDTRRVLVAGLSALRAKRQTPVSRAKHSNTPL
ncbi:MAG: methylmalonyl-CoA carboxyltransferase [Actinomycetota bacterium]|nr:methylmalonyl-CoA carboxyltransferase [Actinomycetota bacterium]